jgi:hypothetical protein
VANIETHSEHPRSRYYAHSPTSTRAPQIVDESVALSKVKSKVTNGKHVFAIGGDGRGAWTRRWRDLVELHSADCGGRDHMSEAQLSLCRCIAAIEVQLEQWSPCPKWTLACPKHS